MRKLQIVTLIVSYLYVCIGVAVYAQVNNAFLQAPQVIKQPSDVPAHSIENRRFTGIPSIAISKDGRMWAIWYAGIAPAEDNHNYLVVSTSGDQGLTWKEVLVIDPDGEGPVRAYDPEVWIDPDDRLWVFWAQAIGHEGTIAGVWSMITADPSKEEPVWSAPRRLTDGIMMCKPTVLTTGEWLLPASTWRLTNKSARVIVSDDHGLTWKLRGACHVPESAREFDEHMIIERNNGQLWMLVRTKYGIGESTSHDQGKTWSSLSPSEIKHPSARFFIRRLQSGNLLLVKHGPMNVKTGRSHLMAFLSKDDGRHWSKGMLLDQRLGVSYPDGQQTDDGNIYLIYDFNRTKDQKILTTNFTELDIMDPEYDTKMIDVYNQRKTVSMGTSKE